MRIKSFFKLLNKKIHKYDKAVSNPFKSVPLPITLVWVEEYDFKKNDKNLR